MLFRNSPRAREDNGGHVAAVSSGLAAVRELLRQHAVARGFLCPAAAEDNEVEKAIEWLLAEHVRVPLLTEAECRRFYEARRKEFRSDDLGR